MNQVIRNTNPSVFENAPEGIDALLSNVGNLITHEEKLPEIVSQSKTNTTFNELSEATRTTKQSIKLDGRIGVQVKKRKPTAS